MSFSLEEIESIIYTIREQRVMLDSDLAKLYGVETKVLTRQVRRNISRFPQDFMFEPNIDELEDLRRQYGAANLTMIWNHMRRNTPMLFSENGVAMLSSVLGSEQAIQVNIEIIRTFTKLRSFLVVGNMIEARFEDIETGLNDTSKLFKLVFDKQDKTEQRIDTIESSKKLQSNENKIGIKRS